MLMKEGNTVLQQQNLTLQNNMWLQAFVQNMPYPTMLVDNNRNIVAGNKKLIDFFKLSLTTNELVGINTFMVLGQMQNIFKDPEGIAKRVLEIVADKQPVLNDRIETIDGRIIFRDYAPFLLDGNHLGHLWIFYDETDMVKVSEVINEQKHFYEDILNKIPSDIAVLSPSLRYLFVNPEAIKNEEVRKWIIGKNDFEFCVERGLDTNIAEKRKGILLKAITEKQELEWEEKIERNGKTSYHIRKVSPVLDDRDDVKLLIGYGYDITQRKEYEKQIELNERKYWELFNYSQAIICTHNMDGVITDVNPAFCEQTGYAPEEATSKNITAFLPGADALEFENNYLEPIRNNQRVKGLFRVVHKTGKLVYLLYQNYKVQSPVEQHTYVVSFCQDVTERIKIEKELKEAKKLTEETARIKEKFLANMSHEIRTPMSGIMGITSLLQKTPLNNEQAGYLKIVQDSAATLLNIVNDILDLEKINTGNVGLEVIPFSITEKLQSAANLFNSMAKAKGLDLILITNFSGQFLVQGDPTRFSQVLNNLIGNAIKFTHSGSVTVIANVIEQTGETITLHTAVEDTGIGIADGVVQTIFTPFTQAYPETTRIYGGTGLGLAISKNLVDMQKGRIWVSSKLNIGSTFHFEIPFLTYKQQAAEMSQTPPNKQGRRINRKIKILLAEDNDINQLLANKIIQHFGFEAETADNGNDAIKLLLEGDFDVILMDIQMPEKNGIETSAEIRALADEKRRNIPIIALTANALKGEEKKYFAVGMNGYLTKPFKEKELYEAIVTVLPEEYLTPVEPVGETEAGTPAAEGNWSNVPKLYSLDDLRMIQKDDDSFVLNIVGLFIQNVPKNAAEMIVACDNSDWERVYFLAHKMKSSIDLVNIVTIKEEVRRVELNAKTKTNLGEIPEKAVFINTVVGNVAAQMKAEFGL